MTETATKTEVGLTFQVRARALLDGLKTVSGIIENSQVMQILSHVKIQVENDRMHILTTDSEAQITTEIPLEASVAAPGAIAVSCRKLMDICRTLTPDGIITFSESGGWVQLNMDRVHFTLASMPVDQFPTVTLSDSSISVVLEEKVLNYLLSSSSFSMADQDVRFYLNGLLLVLDDKKAQVWATDGHRLAMVESLAKEASGQVRCIVPRKSVLELAKLLGEGDQDIALEISGQHIRVKTERFELISNLIEGDYPDCQQLIPHHEDVHCVQLDRMMFKQALDRAMVLSHEKFRAAKLEVQSGVMTIHAHNADQEKTDDAISVQSSSDESISMSFNIKYLQDILSVLDTGEVSLQFVAKHESLCIEETHGLGHKLFVVMSLMF